MDIDKLIEQLKYYGTTYAIGDNLGKEIDGSDELMLNAATALSTLQAENERLKVAADNLEKKYVDANNKWIEAENKWDRLDKAVRNGSVYRPMQEELNLTHEENQSLKDVNAKLRDELERVKRERDAVIKDLRGKCSACANYTPYHNDGPCATCKFEVACFVPEKATDKWQWRGPQKED